MRATLLTLLATLALAASACADEPMEACGGPGQAACEAASWPDWELEDVQPDSARYGERYGLDAFAGEVLVVSFLSGWCPYCLDQAVKLEQLQAELEAEGVAAQIIAVNGVSADNDDDREALTSRCSFPVFQDTEDVDAWGQHNGGKDDFYIYDASGELHSYYPSGAATDLHAADQYQSFKDAILDAVE